MSDRIESRRFAWRDPAARAFLAEHGYVVVRDQTCRLFGYHGLVDGERAFSLAHMFGF